MHESHIKQLKQPLSDGNNTLDYINDYVHLYDILFNKNKTDPNTYAISIHTSAVYRFSAIAHLKFT